MWDAIPAGYRRKQVYTDGCALYDALISLGQLWVCPKGCGDTRFAEGCNNYLRHRVSHLVRKSMPFARSAAWLKRRLLWLLYARSERIKAKAEKR